MLKKFSTMLGAGVAKINKEVQNQMQTTVDRVAGRTPRTKTDPHEFLKAWHKFKQLMEEFNRSSTRLDDDAEVEMEEFFEQGSDDEEVLGSDMGVSRSIAREMSSFK